MIEIGKWRVEEFQEAYFNHFCKVEKNLYSLTEYISSHRDRMPSFFDRRYEVLTYQEEDFDILVERPVVKLSLNRLYGTGWLFKSTEEKPTDPKLLAYFFLHENAESLPVITVRKISESKYLLVDGSHQLYTAYLRKWPYVLVEVEAVYNGDLSEEI